VIGERRGGTMAEALHFFKCEHCGSYFDVRDYGAVLDMRSPCPLVHSPVLRRTTLRYEQN
jgi:hypothetical protein